jgi:coatomer protein complex subunit epsilon
MLSFSITFNLQGGSKIQEAYLIFQDFSEKYTATCMILNGKAQCLMHMGNFEQAEGLLLESLNKVISSHFNEPKSGRPNSWSPTKLVCFSHKVKVQYYVRFAEMPLIVQDPKDAQTLANITVCSLKLGKPASRYLK